MKFLYSILGCIVLTVAVHAQAKDLTVFEKKEGNANIVFARNTGKVPYLVTIRITATGMDVKPGMQVEGVVPAGHMKEMATITPRPGESWSYGYEVSYMDASTLPPAASATDANISGDPATTSGAENVVVPPAPTPALSNSDLILYTKSGCSRCTLVKKELQSKGIAFEEVDINTVSPEVNHMWSQLRAGGFTGDSVTLPVVRTKGKYHYNIKDLMGFVQGLQ